MCSKISLASRGETAPETQRALTRGAARRAAGGARGAGARGRARGGGLRPPPRPAPVSRAGQGVRVIHSAVKGPRHITFIKQLNQSSEPEQTETPRPGTPRATASPEPTPPSVSFSLTSEPQHAPAHEKGPQPGQARPHSPGGSWCSEHRVRTRSTADCARRLPMSPGGHDVVHTATPAEPAVRSPLPIATGLSIDANAWCQAVKPPAPWSEYGAEPQQVVGGGGVRGGGTSMPPTT